MSGPSSSLPSLDVSPEAVAAARAAATVLAIAYVGAGTPHVDYGRSPTLPVEGDDEESFRAYLIFPYKSGAWTVKAVCVTPWHATRAGALGYLI